ncbi:MAG: M28 family peptidase, partial [Actinomycetota bacterium]|nr:M28 family peptidase [Actinomycetota bacterium]
MRPFTPSRRLVPVVAALLAVVLVGGVGQLVRAADPVPAVDTAVLRGLYQPEGYFKAGAKLPGPADFDTALRPLMDGRRFNPSGTYNAYDTNVFEVLGLPYRAAGDVSADDPYGNGGDPRHGFCAADTSPTTELDRPGSLSRVAGRCPNHQLEYSRYFEDTMRDILGDFGVAIHRYRFFNPGSDNTQSGVAVNTAAVVPGTDHPDETVVVSGHFDQTNDGPASAWDSAEGHAEVIRVAKIMADYWRATGTRPSATVKFVPWDAEESGTLGSQDYVEHNVVPGQAGKVRGYFNVDPCAGGYPAFRRGNPADRIPLGIQLANPDRDEDPGAQALSALLTPPAKITDPDARARMKAFNERAPQVVEQVFDYLDDTLTLASGVQREIFVSTAEGRAAGGTPDIGDDVVIGTSRPVVFSSDWKNFEDAGIPFFNPGPETTGPSSTLEPGDSEGISILHTPRDNLQTLNALTSSDQTGDTVSEGWMKGMEMCAHLLAAFMLQPEQGGARPAGDEVVAYYEALPNEASVGRPVRFDATGSSAPGGGAAGLEYLWDFGDGATATGRVVDHTYARTSPADRPFATRLTVRHPATGRSDTVTLPVTVGLAARAPLPAPRLAAPPTHDDDGRFTLRWEPVGGGPEGYVVEEARQRTVTLQEDAERGLGDRWRATRSEGADPALERWQPSEGSPALTGNQRHAGSSSFWTGVSPPTPSPTNQESVLTLTTPVPVPAAGGELSYWSLFRSEGDDQGIVEAAVDDGDASTAPDWQAVDATTGVFTADPAAASNEFERRVADLTQFRGTSVVLRFRYVLGDADRVASQPVGWYVDDVVVESRQWSELARVEATSFEVDGRPPGAYDYRVRAVYEDGTSTAPSEAVSVRVG